MTLLYPLMIFFIISSLLFILNIMFSKKSYMSREKMSPFECGFDPVSQNRLPFSIQFFIISLIFLIFDVEISLLIPLINMMNSSMSNEMILVSILFLWILTIGLIIEYAEKSIDWKI